MVGMLGGGCECVWIAVVLGCACRVWRAFGMEQAIWVEG